MAQKQKKLVLSGNSQVSVVDAALGVGAGLLVPFITDRLVDKWAAEKSAGADATAEQIKGYQSWDEYSSPIGAAVGLVAAIPIGMLKGLGPAIITAVSAITYGGMKMVSAYLGKKADVSSTAPASPFLRGLRVGRPQLQGTRATQGVRATQGIREGQPMPVAAYAGNMAGSTF